MCEQSWIFPPSKSQWIFRQKKITLFFGKKRIDQRNATEMYKPIEMLGTCAIRFKGAIRIEWKQDIKQYVNIDHRPVNQVLNV